MLAKRVADREIAGPLSSETHAPGLGERLGAALASPIGVIIIVPGLVALIGIFLTVLGQNALRESTSTLGRDRFAEQTHFAARGVAASLAHADPLLDRMHELAVTWTPLDPPGPLAHELRGLMQGRAGVAYASVSFPDGAFRGLYLDHGQLRFVDSQITPGGAIVRRHELVGNDGLKLYEEKPWTYDPRQRDFYRRAVSARERVWTKPYPFFSSRQTGVTRAAPVYEPGTGALRAVLTVDFDVDALSGSMVSAPFAGAKTLLYASDGALLAYPEGAETLARMALPPDRALTIGDLHDPAIEAFFAAARAEAAQPGAFLRFSMDSEPMLAMVAPVQAFPQLEWSVAAIVPEQIFFQARIRHERQSRWVATISLLLSSAAAIVFARHVVRVRRQAASASDRARELGSYQLVELLGTGGMGEVWRAEHRLLARQAAIKLIRGEKLATSRHSAANLRRRFRREAQTLAMLTSRHTINLFDYGVTGDGTFFFVMEMLDGMDLDTLVQRDGPQPPGRVIHILLQALSSLAEAHDAGLVHRDVKPANLFVCRAADEVDIVKVLDFGIVQSASEGAKPRAMGPGDAGRNVGGLGHEAVAESRVTQGEQLLGTPSFMAPEQILQQPTDGRADLYALGCVGVWLLSGKTPFHEESAMATLVAHVTRRPDLGAALPGGLPPGLAQLLGQCLEKSPDDRPRDARALAASLRQIELPPAEAWTSERAGAWWAQRRSQSPSPEASTHRGLHSR
jgi:serine/threonine-protein kinase